MTFAGHLTYSKSSNCHSVEINADFDGNKNTVSWFSTILLQQVGIAGNQLMKPFLIDGLSIDNLKLRENNLKLLYFPSM